MKVRSFRSILDGKLCIACGRYTLAFNNDPPSIKRVSEVIADLNRRRWSRKTAVHAVDEAHRKLGGGKALIEIRT